MFNLLRADVYQLRHSKVWWVLITIITALAFLLVFFPYLEEIGVFDKIEGLSVESSPELQELSSVQLMIEAISGPDVFFLVLIFSAFGAFFISSENSNGTIKNVTSMGYRREFIYMSKMSIFTIGAITLAMLFYIIPGTFGSLFFGFGDWPAREILIDTGKIILLSFLYYVAITSIITLFAIVCRGSGITLLFSVGFYLLVGTGLSILGAQYTFWHKINEYSVYNVFTTIGDRVFEQESMVHLTMVPVVTIIVCTLLGLIIFRRKDIQ